MVNDTHTRRKKEVSAKMDHRLSPETVFLLSWLWSLKLLSIDPGLHTNSLAMVPSLIQQAVQCENKRINGEKITQV